MQTLCDIKREKISGGDQQYIGKCHYVNHKTHSGRTYDLKKDIFISGQHGKVRHIPGLFHSLSANPGFASESVKKNKFGCHRYPRYKENHTEYRYQIVYFQQPDRKRSKEYGKHSAYLYQCKRIGDMLRRTILDKQAVPGSIGDLKGGIDGGRYQKMPEVL